MTNDYKVGYGRPPKTSRFKKGQSGNPLGSSRKVRERKHRQTLSLDDLVLEASQGLIRVREGNRTYTISMKEALLRKQHAMALGGNRVAINASIRMIEAPNKTSSRKSLITMRRPLTIRRIIQRSQSLVEIAVCRLLCRMPMTCISINTPAR